MKICCILNFHIRRKPNAKKDKLCYCVLLQQDRCGTNICICKIRIIINIRVIYALISKQIQLILLFCKIFNIHKNNIRVNDNTETCFR